MDSKENLTGRICKISDIEGSGGCVPGVGAYRIIEVCLPVNQISRIGDEVVSAFPGGPAQRNLFGVFVVGERGDLWSTFAKVGGEGFVQCGPFAGDGEVVPFGVAGAIGGDLDGAGPVGIGVGGGVRCALAVWLMRVLLLAS